jgi:hypothetical protein
VKNFGDRQRTEIVAQLARQMVGERLLQPVMLQDGGVDKAGQGGRVLPWFRLLAQGTPDRVQDGRDFFAWVCHR